MAKAKNNPNFTHKVLIGDCIELVPKLGKFDFAFCDPPFNIGQKYRGFVDSWPNMNVYEQWIFKWAGVVWNSIRPAGILCLHGNDALCEIYLRWAKHASALRIAWVNWHYRFGQCHRANWIDARCHCLIFVKDDGSKLRQRVPKHTWNPEAVLVQSDRVEYGDKRIETEGGGMRLPGQVWGIPSDGPYWGRVQGNNGERRKGHPNQLPEAYLKRLLLAYTNKGDLVLDPFCGSGTTATVAVGLGRRAITIDISEENAADAMERISKGMAR